MERKKLKRRLMYIIGVGMMAVGMNTAANAAEVPGQISVKFERLYNGNSMEYAVLEGIDADGSIVWTYETDAYPAAQLDRVTEIGAHDEKYYFCEGETIRALDLSTGNILWENKEFGGSAMDWLFDDQGVLYVCGYFGPDLFAVTPEGKTAKYIGLSAVYLRKY